VFSLYDRGVFYSIPDRQRLVTVYDHLGGNTEALAFID